MGFFSRLSGKRDDGSAELRKAFETINQIIEDEEFQNGLLPEPMAAMIRSAPALDKVPDGKGAFGLEVGNPIPVNGAIGELAYLSKLETERGERLLFHRIGAIDKVDVFEAVTFSGSAWHIFFVDMYYSRRSRLAPAGFRLSAQIRQFSGFHNYCQSFPYDFEAAKQSTAEMLRFAYIPLSNVVPQIQRRVYERPMAHKLKVDLVLGRMTSRMNV